jgi:hypothetical protein
MIGYAYVELNSFVKSSAILSKIVKYANLKGMHAISHIAWYIMSILYIKEGKFDIAYGVLNNSDIQMEKNGITSNYMTMLNKVNMYKVLMCTNSTEQAQICMNQASYIVQKYGLNFNLNIDIKKILKENATRTVELKQTKVQNEKLEQTNSSVPQNNQESVSEKGNENIISEDDVDVVNPSEFFS